MQWSDCSRLALPPCNNNSWNMFCNILDSRENFIRNFWKIISLRILQPLQFLYCSKIKWSLCQSPSRFFKIWEWREILKQSRLDTISITHTKYAAHWFDFWQVRGRSYTINILTKSLDYEKEIWKQLSSQYSRTPLESSIIFN